MSRKSLAWSIAILAGIVVAGSAISDLGPLAQGQQQVFPGGRAGKIRSYYLAVTSQQGAVKVVVPSIEGTHGFVLTDVIFNPEYYNYPSTVILAEGPALEVPKARFIGGGWTTSGGGFRVSGSYHFESGIVFTPGTVLSVQASVTSNSNWAITISGYVF